jgi:hypothetical protein
LVINSAFSFSPLPGGQGMRLTVSTL